MGTTDLKKTTIPLKKLTDRQRRFVLEYLIDCNGTRAAVAAGYSPKGADARAVRLLKNTKIRRVIGALQRKDVEKLQLDREEVLLQLYYLATRKASDFVDAEGVVKPVHEMSERAQAAIDGLEQEVFEDPETGQRHVKTKIKVSPKATAIDMAMKHKGLFAPEKHEHSALPNLDWDQLYIPSGNGQTAHDEEDELEGEVLAIEQQAKEEGNGQGPE